MYFILNSAFSLFVGCAKCGQESNSDQKAIQNKRMQNKKSRPVSAYQRFSWLGCKRLLGASDPILTSFNLTNIQYSDNMTCLLSCSIYIYTYRDTRAMYEVFAVITRANTTYNWQTNLPLYEGCVTTSNLPHPHTQEDRKKKA